MLFRSTSTWMAMEPFQGYAFNLAHSTGYGLKAYVTAYLKAHYPTEFMVARLSVEYLRKSKDLMNAYKKEVIRMGYKVLPPDINLSTLDWQIVDKKTLRESLLVKGVGVKAAQEIIKKRPYTGKDILYIFARKIGPAVSSKVIEAMYDADMWSKEKTREETVEGFNTVRKDKKRGSSGGTKLF